MVKRALLIAFHYPPVKGSSGVQRALKFSTYLRDNGWECDVLTVWPTAYVKTGDDELADIPPHVDVIRAVAFNAKQHFSLFGFYPQFLALPDNWANWRFDGIRRAKAMLKERDYHIIWSTFPIATAHQIGLSIAKFSGLPWVADCRDTMTEEDYPSNPRVFRTVRALESRLVHAASAVTFTTPGALRMYAQRYPEIATRTWRVIENGYDEATFVGLEEKQEPTPPDQPLVLVHAGILYPSERDPLPFFNAIRVLIQAEKFASNPFKVILRATGHDQTYRPILAKLGIDHVVLLEPGIPYREALQEMLLADGLLIFQAANCNHQIPAKVYEYFRAGRPIFALTDASGDTADLLKSNGHTYCCDLTDQHDIERNLSQFLDAVRSDDVEVSRESAAQYSRASHTTRLAELFDELITSGNQSE